MASGLGMVGGMEGSWKAGETDLRHHATSGKPLLNPIHYRSSPSLKNSCYLMPQFSGWLPFHSKGNGVYSVGSAQSSGGRV